MKKIKNLLFADLEQVERYGNPIALMIVVYGLFLSIVNREYFDAIYTMRNGFVCSLQQLLLFLMMLLCGYRAYVAGFIKKNFKLFVMMAAFSVIFFFGWGEKIRWGQFVFQLSLPDFFQNYNTQGQITIHNLQFGNFKVNKVIFGLLLGIMVVVYSIIYPWLFSRGQKLAKVLALDFGLPVPRLSQILWYILTVSIALSIPVHKRGEIVQFAGVWSFAMFFAFPKNWEVFKRKNI